MVSYLKSLSISTQIIAITAAIVLSSAVMIGYFSLHSSNEILRRDAIAAIGSAADYRLQLLITKLSATRTRTQSILQMSDGICSEGNVPFRTCLKGVFEHFAKTTQAASVQFFPVNGPPIVVGADPALFNSIPLSQAKEIARVGRALDKQVYLVVRATTAKGEIRAAYPVNQIQTIFTDREGLGKSGEAFLTDAAGYFLTATNYDGPIGHTRPIDATPIVKCLHGSTGESLGPDFRNVEKVHAFRPVEEIGGGCVMANIEETEAFAKSRELFKNVSQVIILTFLAAIALALLASRWITRPIRRLVAKAEALGSGDFTQQALVTGPREIQTFDHAFRKMTDSLIGEINFRKRSEIELSRAIKSRDEFLATLSHELRTPMNIILGWVEILKTEGESSALFAQATETLERNAIIQKNLIDDLLDVSRIINGKFQVLKEPLDFGAIVRNACLSLQPRALAKKITLECNVPVSKVQVSGDPTKLSQVVTNFVQNSLKFTNESGEITVNLSVQNHCASLQVHDTGIGIDADFLPYVFDRLKQEDMGATRSHSGLGLGLAICKHIVEAHEGKIHVASPGRNQGATFGIEIPLDLSVQANIPVTTFLLNISPATRPRGLHVLIVDDCPDILFLLRSWLEQDGFIVSEAESAGEALRVYQAVQPDVILSDIGMPIEDGYQFISKIRSLPDGQNEVPAIALTAYAREEERSRAFAAGFQLHVSKPTSRVVVLEAVRSFFPGDEQSL